MRDNGNDSSSGIDYIMIVILNQHTLMDYVLVIHVPVVIKNSDNHIDKDTCNDRGYYSYISPVKAKIY